MMLIATLFSYDLCLSYGYQKMDCGRNLPQKEARFLVPNPGAWGTALRAEGGHPKSLGAGRVAQRCAAHVPALCAWQHPLSPACLALPSVLWWGMSGPLRLCSKERFSQRLDEKSVMVDRSAFILCVCFLQGGIVIISTSMGIHGVATLFDEALLRRLRIGEYKSIFYYDMNLTYFY